MYIVSDFAAILAHDGSAFITLTVLRSKAGVAYLDTAVLLVWA
jgi:hypothetical protein